MIKKILKLTLALIVLLFFFFLALISYHFKSKKMQDFVMRNFSKAVIKIFGIKIMPDIKLNCDKIDVTKKTIIVCNHTSYLDIPILLSHFNGRFIVAKNIRKWTVIGWSIAMLGNVFIERGNKESYEKINKAVKTDTIIVFPEGNTSSGRTIKKFKDGAFVAALKNKALILPVVIKYNNKESAWYGKRSLISHLWGICDLNIEADLCVYNLINTIGFADVNSLKKYTRERMLKLYDSIVVRCYD